MHFPLRAVVRVLTLKQKSAAKMAFAIFAALFFRRLLANINTGDRRQLKHREQLAASEKSLTTNCSAVDWANAHDRCSM